MSNIPETKPRRRHQQLQDIAKMRKSILEIAVRDNIAIIISDGFTNGMLYELFKQGSALQGSHVFDSHDAVPTDTFSNRLAIGIAAPCQSLPLADHHCYWFSMVNQRLEHILDQRQVMATMGQRGQYIEVCYASLSSMLESLNTNTAKVTLAYDGCDYNFASAYDADTWKMVVKPNTLFHLPLVRLTLSKLPWVTQNFTPFGEGDYVSVVQAAHTVDPFGMLTSGERIAYAVVELTARLRLTSEEHASIYDQINFEGRDELDAIKLVYTHLYCRLKEVLEATFLKSGTPPVTCIGDVMIAQTTFELNGFYYGWAVTHDINQPTSNKFTFGETIRMKLAARVKEYLAFENPYGLMKDVLGRESLAFLHNA